jgi:hypothetical protein
VLLSFLEASCQYSVLDLSAMVIFTLNTGGAGFLGLKARRPASTGREVPVKQTIF